ncbi:hypothetical protein ACFPPA_10785 [Rhodanobacter ginsengisoli]|uniref:Uncharacterized protein n=1 Tax=Rhodanobacter ginsengisoli TaxID=418646 RepID=A0ABW0QN65_9GAMM
MNLTASSVQLIIFICAIVVAASALTGVVLLAAMRRDLNHALRPSDRARIGRLEAQTRANDRLIESPRGREALVEFFASEIHVSAFLREAEEEIERASSAEEVRAALERMKREDKKRWWSMESLKRGAKAVGEKLFDKANDFIKPYLGGGS